MPLHAAVLKYFDTVARLGSIRRAADRLHVASSAVNRQILKLEDEMGTALFERLPRGVRLTPAGEILARHVRNTLRDSDLVRSDIEELKGLRRGNVIIAAVEGVAGEFLPHVISDFHWKYPNISFTVNVVDYRQIVSLLHSNDADIGLMFNPPPGSGAHCGGTVSLRIGAIMAPNHPLAKHSSLRLRECQAYPMIFPDMTHPNRDWLTSILALSGVQTEPIATTNSFQLMRALAREKLGIAFQTTVGIEEPLRRNELVYVPIADRRLAPSVLAVLIRARQHLPAAASAFLETVRQRFTAMARADKGYA